MKRNNHQQSAGQASAIVLRPWRGKQKAAIRARVLTRMRKQRKINTVGLSIFLDVLFSKASIFSMQRKIAAQIFGTHGFQQVKQGHLEEMRFCVEMELAA